MKKRFLFASLLVLLSGALTFAEQSSLDKAKRSTNDALNNVDKAVHEVGGKATKGGNSFLQSIDDAVHQGWNWLRNEVPPKKEDKK